MSNRNGNSLAIVALSTVLKYLFNQLRTRTYRVYIRVDPTRLSPRLLRRRAPFATTSSAKYKMDVTITYDEVYALVGMNIPSLEPRPNFERIRKLRRHFENALQRLPCPQSVQHGWKGMAMAQNMYALITTTPFGLPISPGKTPRYVRAALLNEPIGPSPLTQTEQATIDTIFKRRKNYYLSMQNIERACFTALDSSVNDAFKLSNTPGVRGWHAGMTTVNILDQLSSVYGKPTAAALDANDMIFRSPYSAADAPEVLFRRIEDCAEIAMIGNNPYTDKQLVLTAVRLLLTTGLYIWAFEDWDLLAPPDQTWVELQRIIQDAFERRLNATALTAGQQGYAPALPYMLHNAFGALGQTNETDEDDSVDTIATQIAAVTLQSQLTATTAANSSQRHDQAVQALAQQNQLLHANQHQILEQLAALSFNASDAGCGVGRGGRGGGLGFPPPPYIQAPAMQMQATTYQQGYAGRGRGRGQGRGGRMQQPQFSPGNFPQEMAGAFPPPYTSPPPAAYGGHMYGYAPQGGMPPQGGAQAAPYSNVVKKFANWNACYSCGFDIPDGHTSMTCPDHLRKPGHDIYFTRQNAQQYIDAGRNCSTRLRHKTQFPAM